MARYGLVIDLKKCVGCNACTMACKAENKTPFGVWWAKVQLKEEGKFPAVKVQYTPMQCMHCQKAPCVDVCPTGATFKRPDGIIAIDSAKCIGCKLCQVACPYGARAFIDKVQGYYPDKGLTGLEQVGYAAHRAGVIEKCTFCVDRVTKGEPPACVETCPSYARVFGDLSDPNSEVSKLIAARKGYQLKPELGTDPSVYYLPI